jgi:hypothetical protein
MRIYSTHCSAQKSDALKASGLKVPPDQLYTASTIRAFIEQCKEKRVDWAILSDLYGVWFPNVKHEWYEKHPDTVTPDEFDQILKGFDQQLQP